MPLDPADFDFISKMVVQRSAIVLEPAKAYLIESRLLPVAHREGMNTISELVAKLRATSTSPLHDRVIDAMTTNETSFFRDMYPFDALRKVILPELFLRRANEKRLNIWCGASSTGQEPYTIAMIFREYFAGYSDWRLGITATDLCRDVLAKAKAAKYSQIEVNRGLPAQMLVKYFQRDGVEWQLKDDVRRMVEFRPLNLIDHAWGISGCDIVFLRNVLIYFDVSTKKTILNKIRQVLRPDGYLFLGGAETTINVDDAFERVNLERTGCYRLRK